MSALARSRQRRYVAGFSLGSAGSAPIVEALNEALDAYGKPDIFNADQGSQFTSFHFTGVLNAAGITISRDGRGRCMDNIFIERLWRSLKYDAVHLVELIDRFHAERFIGEWFGFAEYTWGNDASLFKKVVPP